MSTCGPPKRRLNGNYTELLLLYRMHWVDEHQFVFELVYRTEKAIYDNRPSCILWDYGYWFLQQSFFLLQVSLLLTIEMVSKPYTSRHDLYILTLYSLRNAISFEWQPWRR